VHSLIDAMIDENVINGIFVDCTFIFIYITVYKIICTGKVCGLLFTLHNHGADL